MRLTRFTDYSLRVLTYLALRDGELPTIKEISDAYGISKNHLMKVVNLLTRLKYVTAQRGPGGGLKLGRAPAEINLGKVIRETEEELALVECFDSSSSCTITPACQIKHVLNEALQAFLDVLDSYTLATMLDDSEQLKVLLRIA